eukprot:969654-Alexandrium_andersonii.AAC.1
MPRGRSGAALGSSLQAMAPARPPQGRQSNRGTRGPCHPLRQQRESLQAGTRWASLQRPQRAARASRRRGCGNRP